MEAAAVAATLAAAEAREAGVGGARVAAGRGKPL